MRLRTLILTGGRSTRYGGKHKPAVRVEGISVLERIIRAVTETGDVFGVSPEILIAGSDEGLATRARADIVVVREDPPFTGPLAGIAAGIGTMQADVDSIVLVLAGDLPFVTKDALRRLIEAGIANDTVASPIDDAGYPQYLFAAWPEPLLRERLSALESVDNQPVRRLYAGVALAEVQLDAKVIADIDSPEDLERWS